MSDAMPGPIHRKMTLEEYRDFPRHLGWKYEYLGGEMHVMPYEVMVPLILDLSRRGHDHPSERPATQPLSGEPPSELAVRRVEAGDEQHLYDPFVAAFAETVDFAGYERARFLEKARQCLRHYFGEQRGRRLEASRVAVGGKGLVGALLLREFELGALVDMIFVHPDWRRSGIATRLLETAVEELSRDGVSRLYSSCILGNATSLAWHQHRGFREQPHLQVLGLRARHYREELARRRRLGDATDRKLENLAKVAEGWEERYRELEETVSGDFREGYPIYY